MANVMEIVAVYMDYDHYMKPKEVTKVFRLFAKRKGLEGRTRRGEEQKRIEAQLALDENTAELRLLLDVITCGKASREYTLADWEKDGKKVAILQILDPVTSSLFDKPQEI